MADSKEFEIVPHNRIRNFRLFLVEMVYRTPHMHRDMEICILIDGDLTLTYNNQPRELHKSDMFVIQPFQMHELKAKSTALILSMQVSNAFFNDYFPQINTIEFKQVIFPSEKPDSYKKLKVEMLNLAIHYMKKERGYELKCAGLVNLFFYDLLNLIPWNVKKYQDEAADRMRESRIRSVTSFIDENYPSKLTLSAIAKHEHLSGYYLSHFFRENLGIPFQEYLSRIRSEKARQLLISTKMSLMEISFSCGFSDTKYFRRDFARLYGCSPSEYRKSSTSESPANPSARRQSIPTSQEILTDEQSLKILKDIALDQCQ